MPIEKLISFHIEKQFPAIYREDGQELVQFVKEYYRFLESTPNQSIFNGRRMYEYRDIDTTLERMLLFFKNKYLADLPFDDETVRLIIKNILGLYRRKGTQDGLELFFRLFYNEDIKVYYPARDILKPSDSEWNSGNYLELFPNDGIFASTKTDSVYTYRDIVGKTIIGEASRTKAIVDVINFITINNTISPIIFINKPTGLFIKSENIICEIDGVPVNFGTIKGSLSTVNIDQTAKESTLNNNVGDLVVFETSKGVGGEGFVTEVTENFTGIVNYNVEDGGWGYSIDTTRLLVSNQIVFVEEAESRLEITPSERIEDQLGNTGTIIGRGDFGIGVKASANTEFTNDSIIRSLDRDPLESFAIAPKDIIGNVITLTEALLRAAVGLQPEKARFDAIVLGSRKLGDIRNNGQVTAQDALEMSKYFAGVPQDPEIVDYIENVFSPYIKNNIATYSDYSAFKFVHVNVVPKNDSSPGNLFPDTNDPNDVIVSSLANIETVSLIFDVIGDYVNVQLNSANYNDPPAAQPMSGGTDPVNLNTPLNEAFDLTPFDIGSIVGFNNVNPGIDYVNDVYAIAEDSRVVPFFRSNQLITLVNVPATLNVGDLVSQSGIRGKVLRIQDRTLTVRPYTYFGFNSTTPISYGGSLWPIDSISIDFGFNIAGRNAIINAVTDFGLGKILKINVIDSGYGFIDGERIGILKKDTLVKAGEGITNLSGEGTTGGFWSTLNSHLNGYLKTVKSDGVDEYFDGGKRIQDSNYYQEYSYEIQSTIDINSYESALKEITHVAGTKVFGKFNLEAVIDTEASISPLVID